MKKKIDRIKTIIKTAMATMFLYLLYGTPVMAAPKIITGTQNLASDATAWLTGIIAAITVVMALIKGFAWQTAEEEEKPRKKKAVINTIIIGVVLTCISGLVTVVLSYYV